MKPACATACPTAISYGPRHEMIKEAERRLTMYPDRYLKTVYGKEEARITSYNVCYTKLLRGMC